MIKVIMMKDINNDDGNSNNDNESNNGLKPFAHILIFIPATWWFHKNIIFIICIYFSIDYTVAPLLI